MLTAGYALWALEDGNYPSDATTDAVVKFLLAYQQDKDHYSHPGQRPPSSGSDFTATYVALRGLDTYAGDELAEQLAARRETVRNWLLTTPAQDTEDLVFRLRSLAYAGADEEAIAKAAAQLLAAQRDDGGWSQNAELSGDPYATATVLAALLEEGNLSRDSTAAQRATRYLLQTQQEDGTWHVATRAKGFQAYFESGFPHGKDQFISIAASSWAAIALLRMLPEE